MIDATCAARPEERLPNAEFPVRIARLANPWSRQIVRRLNQFTFDTRIERITLKPALPIRKHLARRGSHRVYHTNGLITGIRRILLVIALVKSPIHGMTILAGRSAQVRRGAGRTVSLVRAALLVATQMGQFRARTGVEEATGALRSANAVAALLVLRGVAASRPTADLPSQATVVRERRIAATDGLFHVAAVESRTHRTARSVRVPAIGDIAAQSRGRVARVVRARLAVVAVFGLKLAKAGTGIAGVVGALVVVIARPRGVNADAAFTLIIGAGIAVLHQCHPAQ